MAEDGVHRVRLFRAPTWCSSGGGGTLGAGALSRGKPGEAQQHAQAYRGKLYRVTKHKIRREWTAARSSTSQGRAKPLCPIIKGVNWEVSEGKLVADC